jgi:hypothetical protein
VADEKFAEFGLIVAESIAAFDMRQSPNAFTVPVW